MFRPFIALSLLSFAVPASAATYSAKPAVPAQNGKIIARDIVWACGPDTCVGATENSRPLVLCQGLAKKAGRIESFIANGKALPADDLASCNSFARSTGDKALANAR
jgi:hypothetical protein